MLPILYAYVFSYSRTIDLKSIVREGKQAPHQSSLVATEISPVPQLVGL